jgi:thiol-disulfide isomerase/thioredoxin
MRYLQALIPSLRPGLALVLFALLCCNQAFAEGLRPFKAGSLQAITAARAGKPFLLLLWSLDCPSCLKEMDGLAASVAKHPELDLVLVSTDEDSYGKEAEAALHKHGLQSVESWIFADANAQRLRYEIDPAWFGELPRSYFYDASHQRLPQSGVLSVESIEAWLAAVKRL